MGYLPPSSSSPPSSTPPSSSTPDNAKPLLLFGHSFGAMIVTHLAQALRDRNEAGREEGREGGQVDVPLVVVSGMAPLDVRMSFSGRFFAYFGVCLSFPPSLFLFLLGFMHPFPTFYHGAGSFIFCTSSHTLIPSLPPSLPPSPFPHRPGVALRVCPK